MPNLASVRVSSRKFYQGVLKMKGGHDQMKNRCGFCKLEYCEAVVEKFGGRVGELGGKASPLPLPVDETQSVLSFIIYFYHFVSSHRPQVPWSNLVWNDFWGTPMHIEGSHKSYRPLTVATFRLNYMLHELQPLGYHLVNVLLHSAVCYLYVLLCGVVFSEVWPALIAGLLFAVHPIHTEAVSATQVCNKYQTLIDQ